MTHPGAQYLAELRESAKKATQGEWDVWREPCADKYEAANELSEQAHLTDGFAGAVFLLNANGKCPATTGCGPTSEANAAHIANASPARIAAIVEYVGKLRLDTAMAIREGLHAVAAEKARADAAEAERDTFKAKDASKSKLLERFRDTLLNMCDHFEDEGDRVFFGSTNDPDELREIAREMDAWKWDAIMGQTKSDPYAKLREQQATIASLTEQLAEAREAKNLQRLANEISALKLHPTTSEEYDAGYIAARGDAFAIVQEAADNATASDLSGDVEGYKHILHASDGHKTVVVDNSEEHPFGDDIEAGDAIESIPLYRATLSRLEKQEGEA